MEIWFLLDEKLKFVIVVGDDDDDDDDVELECGNRLEIESFTPGHQWTLLE